MSKNDFSYDWFWHADDAD